MIWFYEIHEAYLFILRPLIIEKMYGKRSGVRFPTMT